MKKLWNKININPFTYLVILLSLLGGYVKYLIIIIGVLIVHELGHIVLCKLLKKRIVSITVLPFGSIIKMDSLLSDQISEELLISIGGLAFQTILGFLLLIFKSWVYYDTLSYYNKMIIIFNLLPICPLDGYNILKCLIELFVSYKKSLYISIYISIVIIIAIAIADFNIIKDNSLIVIFIIYKIVTNYKEIRYLLNKFYLERIMYTFKYKIKNIDKLDQMYRNKIHYINGSFEREYLIKYKYSRK